MQCPSCKQGKLIEGTLEGVSFEPSRKDKKWFSSGVYGIMVTACSECGRLSDLKINVESLKKIIKE